MLAIRIRFPARRFHATPWSRHVNEAEVAWPPDPWRLCRALIATWHRKLGPGTRETEEISHLLANLATQAPVYRLPPAVHSHARHYMPSRSGSAEKRTLVFDAFACLDAGEELVMAWPGVELTSSEGALLDALLEATAYLGRAESWIQAERSDSWSGEPNCAPAPDTLGADGGRILDTVDLLLPRTQEDYQSFRAHFLEAMAARGESPGRRIAATLPEDWLRAVAVETADLHAAGWSQPPAARQVRYVRPAGCLVPAATPRARRCTPAASPTTVRFAVYGRPLPRIEDAVRVGEWLRAAVMGRARWVFGPDQIPDLLSGHTRRLGHRHAFFLADAGEDGLIDHVIVHAAAGFDDRSLEVLGRLDHFCSRDGRQWKLILESAGAGADPGPSRLLGLGTTWESLTPYLHPWHSKKGFTVADQLRRECSERGLPALAEIEPVPALRLSGRERRPVHFHRFRSKRGLTQPDTRGGFWRLTFDAPAAGPLALGFGCHFGLGTFGRAGEV